MPRESTSCFSSTGPDIVRVRRGNQAGLNNKNLSTAIGFHTSKHFPIAASTFSRSLGSQGRPSRACPVKSAPPRCSKVPQTSPRPTIVPLFATGTAQAPRSFSSACRHAQKTFAIPSCRHPITTTRVVAVAMDLDPSQFQNQIQAPPSGASFNPSQPGIQIPLSAAGSSASPPPPPGTVIKRRSPIACRRYVLALNTVITND